MATKFLSTGFAFSIFLGACTSRHMEAPPPPDTSAAQAAANKAQEAANRAAEANRSASGVGPAAAQDAAKAATKK